MQYREFISESLQTAAQLAIAQFGKVAGTTKPDGNNQVLTETDIAIGKLLIGEACGKYTDFFGTPMDYSNPLSKADPNFTFCVASPILHNQLQEILAPFGNKLL